MPKTPNPEHTAHERALDDAFKLLPDEELLSVKEKSADEELNNPKRVSSLRALQKLVGHKNLDRPVMAAVAGVEHVLDPSQNLYAALFGRDSERVALNIVGRHPELARATLIKLAELQGVVYSKAREEEPGRIPHEIRDVEHDEIARRLTEERGWGWPYYGEVDSTPLFISTLAAYCRSDEKNYALLKHEYRNKDGKPRIILDALNQSVDWLVRRMDSNPEGLLEYRPAFKGSIENQVWRDSWDGFSHSDGTLANTEKGIAALDAQLIAMDALYDAAELYRHTGTGEPDIDELVQRANRLKRTVMERFWVDRDGGFFALGVDRDERGNLRQLDVCSSDMGHVLNSRLLDDNESELVKERRKQVIARLFSEDMLSQNGIRTLSSKEVRFRAGSYHNGSVWAWDNYLIAQGLDRHGYHYLAGLLKQLLLDGVSHTGRLPEYWRGDNDAAAPYQLNKSSITVWDKAHKRENVVEQPPQDIQAWTAAAIYAIRSQSKNFSRSKFPHPEPFEIEILSNVLQRSKNQTSGHWRREIGKLRPGLLEN